MTIENRNEVMDACAFTYISKADSMPKHAIGIEQSWEELKRDFDRTGPECPDAMHFKTISLQGPQLFAVTNDNQVFYHDNGHWYRYITAFDVKFGIIESSSSNIQRTTSDQLEDWIMIPHEK